jgi:hypothetical protein
MVVRKTMIIPQANAREKEGEAVVVLFILKVPRLQGSVL